MTTPSAEMTMVYIFILFYLFTTCSIQGNTTCSSFSYTELHYSVRNIFTLYGVQRYIVKLPDILIYRAKFSFFIIFSASILGRLRIKGTATLLLLLLETPWP